jgi:hypothetical protein
MAKNRRRPTTLHNDAYKAFLDAIRDPTKITDLHSDPLVGRLARKLTKADFQALSEVAAKQTVQACCQFPPLGSANADAPADDDA